MPSCPVSAMAAQPSSSAVVAAGNVGYVISDKGESRGRALEEEADSLVELFRIPPGHVIAHLCPISSKMVACSSTEKIFVVTNNCADSAGTDGGRAAADWDAKFAFAASSRICVLKLLDHQGDVCRSSTTVSIVCVTCKNVASLLHFCVHTGTCQLIRTVSAPRETGLSFAAAVTPSLVLSGNYSGSVFAWSWRRQSNSLDAVLPGQHRAGSVIYSIAAHVYDGCSSAQLLVATASDDRTVCLSSLRSDESVGHMLWRSDMSSARMWVVAFSFRPSGHVVHLATGGEDGCVAVYSFEGSSFDTSTPRGTLTHRLEGCHGGAGVSSLAWTRNGTLVSGGASGRVMEHHWLDSDSDDGERGSVTFQRCVARIADAKIRCLQPLFAAGGLRPLVAVCTGDPSQLVIIDPMTASNLFLVSCTLPFKREQLGRPQLPTVLSCSAAKDDIVFACVGSNRGTIAAVLMPLSSGNTNDLRLVHESLGSTASVLCLDTLFVLAEQCVAAAVAADGQLHILRWTAADLVLRSHQCVACGWRGAAASALSLCSAVRSLDSSLVAAVGAKGGITRFFSVAMDSCCIAPLAQFDLGVDRPVQSLVPLPSGSWRVVLSNGQWMDVSAQPTDDPSSPPLPRSVPQSLPWPVAGVVPTRCSSSCQQLVTISNGTVTVHKMPSRESGRRSCSAAGSAGLWSAVEVVPDMRAPHLYGAAAGSDARLIIAFSPDGSDVVSHVGEPRSRMLRCGVSGRDLNASVGLRRGWVAVAGEDTAVYLLSPANGCVVELSGGHTSNVLAMATAADDHGNELLLSVGGRCGTALWRRGREDESWALIAVSEAGGAALDAHAVPRVLCTLLTAVTAELVTATLGLSDGRVVTRSWALAAAAAPVLCDDVDEAQLGSPPFCVAVLMQGVIALGCGSGALHVLEGRTKSSRRAATLVVAPCALNCVSPLPPPQQWATSSFSFGNSTNRDVAACRMVCGTDGGDVALVEYQPTTRTLALLAKANVSATACRGLVVAPPNDGDADDGSTTGYTCMCVAVTDATLYAAHVKREAEGWAVAVTARRHLSIRGVASGCCRWAECRSAEEDLDCEKNNAMCIVAVGCGVEESVYPQSFLHE